MVRVLDTKTLAVISVVNGVRLKMAAIGAEMKSCTFKSDN